MTWRWETITQQLWSYFPSQEDLLLENTLNHPVETDEDILFTFKITSMDERTYVSRARLSFHLRPKKNLLLQNGIENDFWCIMMVQISYILWIYKIVNAIVFIWKKRQSISIHRCFEISQSISFFEIEWLFSLFW